MSTPFRAFVVHQAGDALQMGIESVQLAALPPDQVLVRVAYAAVHYKDALVCHRDGKVARTSPLIPGLECSGEVVESSDPEVRPGDRVLVHDFGKTLGVARHGGFSEYIRVPRDFVFALPPEISFQDALVLSASMAAAQAVRELERHDLTPARGPVLVTGASGGMGSMAVRVLAQRGYTVAASTGKPEARAYLERLGATEVVSRVETSADSPRFLDAERWAGSIDMVGGATLAYLMRTTKQGGGIAAIGVAGGAAFHATVFPLILRGIRMIGIDLPSTSIAVRRALWTEALADRALLTLVDDIVTEVELADVPRVVKDVLAGRTRGRVLVRLAS